MLHATDLVGVYAIIPTPATRCRRWDAVDTVDLAESERVLNALIADGVTAHHPRHDGEVPRSPCPNITRSSIARSRPSAAHPRLRRCERARYARGHRAHALRPRTGADGVLAGLPQWQPCTTDMAVEFYATPRRVPGSRRDGLCQHTRLPLSVRA